MAWRRRLLVWASLVVGWPLGCSVLADNKLADKPTTSDSGAGGQGGGANSGKKLGDACLEGGECASGNCVDGVCCNNGCTGPCKACNLGVDDLGICKPHPVGTDPQDDCTDPQVCDANSMCVNVEGQTCTVNATCTSMHCVDGFCCDSACDGKCEGCSAALTGGINGLCAGLLPKSDPDGECSAMTGGCFAPGLCCGEAPPPPGGNCPNECDDCNNGTCHIVCDGNCPTTINCPAGFACLVSCAGDNSCKGHTIDCPADFSCDVECGDSNHRCQNAQIYCKNGPCFVDCVGGDACDGTVVHCGSNACDANCIGSGKPNLNCNNSCDCPGPC
jgi:hypothetical protein